MIGIAGRVAIGGAVARRVEPSAPVLRRHGVLPGFRLALGFALLCRGFIVLIPLSAVFPKTFGMALAGRRTGRRRRHG